MSDEQGNGGVSVIIPTKEPNEEWLMWTLRSLEEQTVPPLEVIVVDGSDPPLRVDSTGALNVRTYHRAGLGIGAARRFGAEQAAGPHLMHTDEDAVLLREDYIERAMEHLSSEGVVGVGGVVFPIQSNPSGHLVTAFDRMSPSPLSTHHILHPKYLCPDGQACFQVDGRGEDLDIRSHLRQHGEIRRDGDLVALKDMPTNRQKGALQSIGAAAFGGIATAVGSTLGSAIITALTE
jgi:glycosyltransferase involved in cell wall biosynthesis